jgi:hypothetical protein
MRNQSQDRRQASHNILMVDQLWLWFIKRSKAEQPDIVVTSFPNRDSTNSKLDDILLNDRNRDPFFDTSGLVSQIMAECCKTLSLGQDNKSTKFLEFFEGTIGQVVSITGSVLSSTFNEWLTIFQEEKETQLLREFRFLSRLLSTLDESHPQYRKLRAILPKHLDILKEVKLLTEVKDILDEIKMIKSVLTDQTSILESEKLKELIGDSSYYSFTDCFSKPRELVEIATKSFDNMKARAEAVENGVRHKIPALTMPTNSD